MFYLLFAIISTIDGDIMYRKLIGNDKGTIEIFGYKYYFKRNDAYVEILVEKIENLFNLHHANYIPITVKDINYYLSKDLNCQGSFITAEDLGLMSYRLNDIKNFVRKCFPNNYEYLEKDILKMFYMDLMILNIDRSNSNWGFLSKDNNTSIYLLDNELSFIHYVSMFTTLNNNIRRNSMLEVENIFNTFSDKDMELFYEMYSLLDYDMLIRLIEETEKDIKRELMYKENYLKRFETLRLFIEKNIEKKKKIRKL